MTSMPYQRIANLTHTVRVQPDSIISRPLYSNKHLRIVLFAFAAGQELSEHTAAMPVMVHILSGTAQITLGADAFDAQPHTWTYMTINQPHSIKAKTDMVMMLTMLKSALETEQAED